MTSPTVFENFMRPAPAVGRAGFAATVAVLCVTVFVPSLVFVAAKTKSRFGCAADHIPISFRVLFTGFALVCVSVFLGALLATQRVATGVPSPRPTACEAQLLSYNPHMLTPPWDAATPQWVAGLLLVGTFIARRYCFAWLAAAAFPGLTGEKRAKICNYLMELTVGTFTLVTLSVCGYWRLLFFPGEYASPSPETARVLATGLQLVLSALICAYIVEMACDPGMRLELVVHHAVVVLLLLWFVPTVFAANFDVLALRVCLEREALRQSGCPRLQFRPLAWEAQECQNTKRPTPNHWSGT